MRVQGKQILLTGASSGIGEALAIALSHKGAKLILTARRTNELERVRANCHNPDDHSTFTMDLSNPELVGGLVKEIIAQNGVIDILINNAGISQRSRVEDTNLTVEQHIMAVNYFSCLAATRAVLPGMREKNAGQIVVISSLNGKFSTPRRSSYSASKHALHGYFESLRGELHDSGINITMVCPGFINTPISLSALKPDGSHWGAMDEAQAEGISAEKCAAAVTRAIERNTPEIFIAGKEKIGVYLQRFAPFLFRRIIHRLAPP